MRIVAFLSILALLLTAGCGDGSLTQPLDPEQSRLARAAQESSHSQDHARPFFIRAEMGAGDFSATCDVAVPNPQDPENPITVHLPASFPAWGNASHLGRFSSVITQTECSFDLEAMAIANGGEFETTASNGDVITGTWTGHFYPDNTMEVSGVFEGGTGRFADVSGWMELEGYTELGVGGWFAGGGELAY